MNNVINEVINKIKSSKIFEKVMNFFNSFKTDKVEGYKSKVDDFCENKNGATNNTNITEMIMTRVNKILKKFGKKFKNEDKAKGVISKIVSFVTKTVSIIATIGFSALVLYIIIKLLPTIIMMVATIFAIYICVEFIMAMLNRAVLSK